MQTQMTPAQQAERAAAVQELIDRKEELKALRESYRHVLFGEGYIVVNPGGVHLAFTVENRRVTTPRFASVQRATRFTRRDAEAVAATVTNGNGERATAMHINQALDEEIARLGRVIEMIQGLTV